MEPVRCFSCGLCLNSKLNAFNELKILKYGNIKNNQEKLDTSNEDLTDIFEFLYIRNICCKKILNNAQNMHKMRK